MIQIITIAPASRHFLTLSYRHIAYMAAWYIVTVRTLDLRSRRRRFNCRSDRYQVLTT